MKFLDNLSRAFQSDNSETRNSTAPPNVPQGITIGRYRLRVVKLLEEGGFGYVYACVDENTNRQFALKKVNTQDKERYSASIREAKLLTKFTAVKNSKIIKCYGYKEMRSQRSNSKFIYILMELARGGNMVNEMNKRWDNRFSEKEILKIFHDTCIGVAVMHSFEHPIFHRDLKVENILNMGRGEYRLCDFGSASTKALMTSSSREAMCDAEGVIDKNTTLAYRSPEMVDLYSGDVINEKGDIWALGCILYKLAYYVGPFEDGAKLQLMQCRYKKPEAMKPKFSKKFTDLINLLLLKDPKARPDIFTVLDLICELRQVKNTVSKPKHLIERKSKQFDNKSAPTSSLNPSTKKKATKKKSAPKKKGRFVFSTSVAIGRW